MGIVFENMKVYDFSNTDFHDCDCDLMCEMCDMCDICDGCDNGCDGFW